MNKLLTPKEVWQEYREEEPFHISVVKEYKKQGILYKHFYFTSRRIEKEGKIVGTVRVYGILALQEHPSPVILILPHKTKGVQAEWVDFWLQRGYSAMSVDFSGVVGEFSTVYPQCVQYAIPQTARPDTQTGETARESAWYEWVYLARRAVQLLTNLKSVEKIGVFGLGSGSDIAWILASTVPAVSAVVAMFGGGWLTYQGYDKYSQDNEPPFDDAIQTFVVGLSAEIYAPFARTPILYIGGSNDKSTPIERACDTLVRVPENTVSRFCFNPNLRNYVSHRCSNSPVLWFNKFLKGKGTIPVEPRILLQPKEPYNVLVQVDSGMLIDAVEIYYSEGEITPQYRYWKKAEAVNFAGVPAGGALPDNGENNVYYATIQPIRKNVPVFFYANVYYATGLCLSTPLVVENSDAFQSSEAVKSRVVYGGGKELPFTCSRKSDYSPTCFLSDDPVHFVNGPDGVKGVTCRLGVASFKIASDEILFGEDSRIAFDIASRKPMTLTVSVTKKMGTVTEVYTSDVELQGGNVWERVILEKTKLKKQGVSMKSWRDVKKISFDCKEATEVPPWRVPTPEVDVEAEQALEETELLVAGDKTLPEAEFIITNLVWL